MFGVISAALSVIGIFGVMAHAVNHRKNEIGIRIALGAPSSTVLTLILRHGILLVAIGLASGTMAALVLTRIIQNLLWGVTPTDPVTFTLMGVALGGVALLACYLPARRALKIDPIIALRIE
jgi:ABC-type antimicrobial peptide transport system permease subunit